MSRSYVWLDMFICVTWLRLRILNMQTPQRISFFFLQTTRLIHTCDITPSFQWRDAFICNITRSCAWHDSFIRVTWLRLCMIKIQATLRNVYMWHDLTIRVTSLLHLSDVTHSHVTLTLRMCDMNLSYVWHDSHSASKMQTTLKNYHVWHHSLMWVKRIQK